MTSEFFRLFLRRCHTIRLAETPAIKGFSSRATEGLRGKKLLHALRLLHQHDPMLPKGSIISTFRCAALTSLITTSQHSLFILKGGI